jgi:hypothetical protein
MNEKWKWRTAGRLRRGAVVLGVVGLTASLGVLTAGVALAGVGAQPGDLQLLQGGTVLATGTQYPLTTATTWQTTTACPSGFQTSAQIEEFTAPAGTAVSLISGTATAVTVPFSGLLDSTPGALLAFAGISATAPGTAEWAVGCASSTGSIEYEQSIFLTVASGATTFSLSATGPSITGTTTTLTTTPASPTTTGTSVTLSASVTASDGTTPAGTVQFEVGGTDIGTPVAVNTGGTAAAATTTDTFTTAGTEALSAVFTPTNTTTYASSTGTYSLVVETAGSLPATGSPVPITVTVGATGVLSVTVVNTTVALTENSAGTQATGTLGDVTVSDSRNTFPGWSVSGQESAFAETGGTASIPGDDLGWVPAAVGTLGTGVTLGPTIAPGTSPGGLGDTGGVLISAPPGDGFGTNEANAALTLNIPTGQAAGSYAGSMTVTYLSVGP